MTISLHSTQSPVSRAERNKINENWSRIITGLTNLQIQINILAGGEVDALLERLNKAVNDANIAVQQAIAANDAATQDAINANNTALQTALQTVSNTLTELNGAITNANDAATNANEAADDTNQAIQNAQKATKDAIDAVTTMQNFVNQLSPKSKYNNEVHYSTNNIVTLNGSSFIALQDTQGNLPPTPSVVSNLHWQLIAEKGANGDKGDKGERGTDGKDGTGVTILGSLPDETALPPTGQPGDAYMINGNLYVWSDDTDEWKNVGPIRGPQGKSAYDLAVENGFEGSMDEWIESLKGERGPRGPEGPPGPPGQDADLTEVTEQLAEIKQTTENHIKDTDKHLKAGERTKITNAVQKAAGYHPENDANKIAETSVYGLDGSGINGPPVAQDGWSTIFTASSTGTDRAMQFGQKWNDASGLLWYRRNNTTWENWKQIFLHHNTRLSNINLNDFNYTGTYALGDGIVNAPNEDGAWGVLFVTRSDDYTHQTYHGLGGTYQRQLVGGAWKPWKRLLTQSDYDQLFTLFGDKNVKIASAITDKGVPTSADATGDQMANNIRAIPSGKNIKEGSMVVPSLSGSQRVTVDVDAGFAARNASTGMGGMVMIQTFKQGSPLNVGPYTSDVTVIGNTVRFTYAMGNNSGSFAGGSVMYCITG